MRKTIYLLIIALLFVFAQNPDLAFGFGSWGGSYTPYGGSGTQLMRPTGFWVYKNGGMIGMDDIARGTYVAYSNGRPVYQKAIQPPDIDKTLTSGVTIELKVPTGTGGETETVKLTITGGTWGGPFTLRSFFGYKIDGATGVEVVDDSLEEWLEANLASYDLSDADLAKLASSAREQVAQGLSVYAGGLNPELYSFTEAFYSYNNGLLNQIKSTAVDQNGDVIKNADNKTLYSIDTYAAGVLISRSSFMLNYKFNADGDPVEVGGKYDLDKANPIEITEQFYYENGVQRGSIQTNTTAFTVNGKDKDGNAYTFTVAAGSVLGRNVFDNQGRITEEQGVLGVNATNNGLVVGLTTKHEYGEAGREVKTTRYFGTETVDVTTDDGIVAMPKEMEVTERVYNATGQLAYTNTTLLESPGFDEDKGEIVYWKATQTANTTYQYNSLGQVYFADTVNRRDGSQSRTYYVYNRELVKFSNSMATWQEPPLPN